ncbi:hypothetical protein ABT263_35855 [Kitasatospora sp. NPDC001603]|uniref:hypothetical protein n=1 Tax=Kitasatospora sp. NPDC001603 TaxID=3154388 RepID=UPI003321C505
MARLTVLFIRYFPHLLVMLGMLTAGSMWNTDHPAASFPDILIPIAMVAVGVGLAFIWPPHRRRRR